MKSKLSFLFKDLQEEAESSRRHEYKKSDFLFKTKSSTMATPLPLPLPPQKHPTDTKLLVVKGTETMVTANNKVATLRAYRMAKGLCKFGAEKCVKGYKCASVVPLHVVQELWELFQLEDDVEPQSVCS
jgi:hypothetical protein